ncbi:MAG: ROK family protein [Pyramidobacter sp.]|jgi:glucokinase
MIAAADVGGHTLAVGLVDDGIVTAEKSVATPVQRTPEAVMGALESLLKELKAPDGAPLALGVPGMVDRKAQRVQCVPNQNGWNGLAASDLERMAGRPVFLANDCDCAAVGEMACGAAKGLKNFLFCSLGTGVGGSVVVNGQLVQGLRGRTGEIGHFPLLLDKGCGCGGRGHVESFFSADVLEAAGEKCGYGRDMKVLWEKREDAWLAMYFATGLRALACAFVSVIHLLDPEAIVVGGGLSHLEGLLDDLRDYMQPLLAPPYRPGPDMRLARLGSHGPLLGAAELLKEQMK